MTQYQNPIAQKAEEEKRPKEQELDSNGRPQSENQAKGGQQKASLGGGKAREKDLPKPRTDDKIQETNIH